MFKIATESYLRKNHNVEQSQLFFETKDPYWVTQWHWIVFIPFTFFALQYGAFKSVLFSSLLLIFKTEREVKQMNWFCKGKKIFN